MASEERSERHGAGRLLAGITVLWAGLAFAGDGLTSIVLPVLTDRVTGGVATASTLGLVTFAGLAVGALVQPPAGALSDRLLPRYGRRGPLAAGLALTVAGLAVLGVAGHVGGVAGLVVGFVAVAASASIAQASLQGWIPDLVASDRRGRAAGWKGFADVGGASIAFFALGQAIGGGAGRAVAVIIAALASAGLLALGLVREPPRVRPAPHAGSSGLAAAAGNPDGGNRSTVRAPALAAAFRIDRSGARPLVDLVAARFLFLFGVFAVGRFLVLVVADRFGVGAADAAEQASLVLGVLALVSMVAAPASGRAADQLGRRPVMVAGALAGAAAAAGLAAAPSLPLLVGAGVALALGNAAFTTANWAMTTDVVPADEAARHLGLANLGTAGAMAAAGLLGPVMDVANRLGRGWGGTVLLLIAACAMAAAAVVATRARHPTAAAVAPAPPGAPAARPRG